MELKILSAKSIPLLEELASQYTIKELGSLSISNGQYFLAVVVEKPKVEPEKPKTTRKRRTTSKK